ncbi:zinc finger protein ZAT5 [Manihot esculenta]|uniref:C2H2-type domain-containing protein n=1 Tax=Manihot esculenta TaxID=3983 RepID=A0A2C9VYK3_MANES|nr:zinc finger protein ZAT5 [Manihot esculenta]OAY51511.1 hypothetical protein MANES_04G012800v8 [Manihot esculenta]
MAMELAQEEFMGSNDPSQIVKGKRSKRLRSSSAGITSSSSSGTCGGSGGGEPEHVSISSPTSCSDEIYESTEEEEDMANCLILLAQGDGPRRQQVMRDENNRKFSEVSANPTTNKASFFVYECKTCNRSFPSFQALGGHRASHKKPKSIISPLLDELQDCQLNKSSPDHHLLHPLSLQISNKSCSFVGNNKSKIHECAICGSEFTSGQALGGHMRRHRANSSANNNQVVISATDSSSEDQIKQRNILALDLNLPAPEEDHHHHRESKFQFPSTQQALAFSAPTLVDCHY